MRLFSYVVARDFGFAPNPFYGFCTLATCKPQIRCAAQIGDFVLGTAPSPNTSRIVFYMRVEEKLTFAEYWDDARFINKKPNLYSSTKAAFGDNIYRHDNDGNWMQLDSHHTHYDGSPSYENIETDTSCDAVLVSGTFSYWGGVGPQIPAIYAQAVKRGPGYKSAVFSDHFVRDISGWLLQHQGGFHGTPADW